MTQHIKALGAAACALLGPSAPTLAAEAKWEIDSATMVYSETHRVSLVEPVASARRTWDDRSIGARITLDTLTGPSPNGALKASTPQTFTGPSGGDSYTAKAGETPLDDTFKDTRVAVALDYSAPLLSEWIADYGVNVSTEYDYQSLGGSLRLQRDFNQHNTTLAFGGGYARDTIDPVGGVPIPLSVMQVSQGGSGEDGEGDDEDKGGGSKKNKSVTDFLVGVTQVLDPNSLVRVNLVLSQSSGYQTDPYKLLSVVGADGEPLRYVYEKRPRSRTKSGIYTEYRRAFGEDSLRVSYRFLDDDWGSNSHTIETAYRWHVGESSYVEPQVRWYTQDAADFYRVALFDGEETTVGHASADYRLGGMTAWTAGVQVGHTLTNGSDLSLRLAYYVQSPDENGIPAQAADGLSKFGTLVPDTKAVIATLAYRFDL